MYMYVQIYCIILHLIDADARVEMQRGVYCLEVLSLLLLAKRTKLQVIFKFPVSTVPVYIYVIICIE